MTGRDPRTRAPVNGMQAGPSGPCHSLLSTFISIGLQCPLRDSGQISSIDLLSGSATISLGITTKRDTSRPIDVTTRCNNSMSLKTRKDKPHVGIFIFWVLRDSLHGALGE